MREKTLENPLEKIKSKPLNELVSYYQVSPNQISVHVVPENNNLQNQVGLMRAGLKILAGMLENNPDFASVKIITATSWIGTEHPNSLRYFGFHVDEKAEHSLAKEALRRYALRKLINVPKEYRDIKPTFAFMSREDFLAQYGSQSSSKGQSNL